MPGDEELIGFDEACRMLGVGVEGLRALLREHGVRYVRVGGRKLLRRAEVSGLAGPAGGRDPVVGKTLGGCEVLEKLGESRLGLTYKAVDAASRQVVVLRLVAPKGARDAAVAQALARAASLAARIAHPNVVAIHRAGCDEVWGVHYLVMEFVEGRPLADLVKELGPLPWNNAVPLLLEACDALATAHERGVVHGDVKPENLLLDTTGRLKVANFGFATPAASAGGAPAAPAWSRHYTPPEQAAGKPPDARADTFSLGATFYYLVSKCRPFGSVAAGTLASSAKATPLPSLVAEVPPGLWAVVRKMIAARPAERYASLREVIADLRRLDARGTPERALCPACGAPSLEGGTTCAKCAGASPARARPGKTPARRPPPRPTEPPPPSRAEPAPSARPLVFVSAKSEDYEHARRVAGFLRARGVDVFFSDDTLPQLGSSDYGDAIDAALERADHLVVVTSCRAHAESRWVRYEWKLFQSEVLAGRKAGNLVTLTVGGLDISELPIALRNREVMKLDEASLERLLPYVARAAR